MDVELDRLRPASMPADMQSWNIEDLRSYVKKMKVEIAKVEDLIYHKNNVQSAAAALFDKNNST